MTHSERSGLFLGMTRAADIWDLWNSKSEAESACNSACIRKTNSNLKRRTITDSYSNAGGRDYAAPNLKR